jgi:hypothetical protein
MPTAVAAWKSAELRGYEYLEAALQGIDGVTAFSPEDFPRKLDEGETEMWTFEVDGDSPKAQTATVQKENRPLECWAFGAELRGIFETRGSAQTVAGMAMTALPADSTDMDSVGFLSWAAMPSIVPTIIEKGDAGRPERAWALTFPLWIRFGNSDYAGDN